MAVFLSKTFDLDVEPGALPPILRVKQYDGDGTKQYTATLYSENQTYTIPSDVAQIELRGSKPDGTGFSYVCTYSGSQIVFTLTRQMTVKFGDVICEFVLLDANENRLSSHVFIMRVHRAAVQQDQIESSDEYTTFTEYIEQAEENAQLSEYYKNWAKSWAVGDTGLRDDEDTNNAERNGKMAQSYAVGGTGIRIGEDTDNAQYYASIVNNVQPQVEENTDDIAALEARINQYVVPSSQYPDEVVAARVGYDGTTYTNLGEAVRSQVTIFGYIPGSEEIYFDHND